MRREKVPTATPNTLGYRLASLRKQAGFSQKELANTVRVAQPQISAWESNQHTPSAPNLKSLAKALGTTIPFLLHGVQKRTDTSAKVQPEMPVLSVNEQIANIVDEDVKRKSALLRIPGVQDADTLHDLLMQQRYTAETVHAIKVFATSSIHRKEIFRSLAEIIVSEGSGGNIRLLGLCASVLAVSSKSGGREITVLVDDLERICLSMIKAESPGTVGVIEPLAFLLGIQNRPDALTTNISKMIEDRAWRHEDSERIRRYYGSLTAQVTSLLAHGSDPRRKDILIANDTHRLLEILKIVQEDESLSSLRPVVSEKLKACAAALRLYGQDKLARKVLDEAAGKKEKTR